MPVPWILWDLEKIPIFLRGFVTPDWIRQIFSNHNIFDPESQDNSWIPMDAISFKKKTSSRYVSDLSAVWTPGFPYKHVSFLGRSMYAETKEFWKVISASIKNVPRDDEVLGKPIHGLHEKLWLILFREKILIIISNGMVSYDTVDGRNAAPPGMYKTLLKMGYLSYQLVQDFFHQQYHQLNDHHSPRPTTFFFAVQKMVSPTTSTTTTSACTSPPM